MDRKKYWDKTYAEYWHERVKETKVKGEKSSVISNDTKTESDAIYKDIFEKNNFFLVPSLMWVVLGEECLISIIVII